MPLSRDAERARGARRRRAAGIPERRLGSASLSQAVRNKKQTIARRAFLKKKPTAPVASISEVVSFKFQKSRLRAFQTWYMNSSRGAREARFDPGVLGSVAAAEGVPDGRKALTILYYWRLDNRKSWSAVGALLQKPNPEWNSVQHVLRGLGQGSSAAVEHRFFTLPGLPGTSAAEQSTVLMKRWHNCFHRLDNCVKGLGSSRLFLLEDILREIFRLYGIGPYTAVCVSNTLLIGRYVSDSINTTSFPVGPGSGSAALYLAGHAKFLKTSKALWPWSKDPQHIRQIVIAIAAHMNINFVDAQHALCSWIQAEWWRRRG